MSETKTCPKCETRLPGNALAGICPTCLMQAALDSPQESSDAGSAFAATTPLPGGFVPPEPDLLVPHFPQLEILEPLGHGGMGAVYKARQLKLDRFVALKIIRPESADDAAFAERFNREARTLARLSHPNIVAIHDFGEVTFTESVADDSTPRKLYYFLMEFVDGANLRQLIQRAELQPEQSLAIVPQICEALQFAHDEGIVHRDIKPENILLDQRGRVKIADFGLAKLASHSEQDFTLTGTHQVMGTPRYMAPEQMEGSHAVDHRADIYSLGVVFYEMLTGQVPMGQFEPPSKKASVDGRLDQIVMQALAREPERRYQQASDVKTDVDVIRQGAKHTSTVSPEDTANDEANSDQITLADRRLQPALLQLQGPSKWLLVISIINWVGIPLGAAIAAILIWEFGDERMRGDEDTWTGLANCVFLLPLNAVVMIAALKLRRLRAYWIGLAGSALAMVIPPGLLLGIPVGIWTLVVLGRRDVKQAFGMESRAERSPRLDDAVGSSRQERADAELADAGERGLLQANAIESSVEPIPPHLGDPAPASAEASVPPRPAGFSTIAEREVQNAWRWIAGESGETDEQRPTFPAMLMIGLSIAGCLMLPLPWLELEIDKSTVVRSVPVELHQPVSRTLSGSDRWPGIASTVAFACLALLVIITPTKQSPGTWRAAAMTAVAAFALLHTFLFRVDFESGSYPLSIATASYTSDMGDPLLSEIDHRITFRSGFYTSLGLSLSLLLLSAVGIRRAVGQQSTLPSDSRPNTAPPLTSVRFTVPTVNDIGRQIVFHFSGLGYQLVDEQPAAWVFQRGSKWAGWSTHIRALHTTLTVGTTEGQDGGLLLNCVWAVQAPGAWIGGRGIKKLQAEGHALQSLLTGSDDQVADESNVGDASDDEAMPEASYTLPALDIRRIELRLKGPAGGLIVAAALTVVFWCIQLVMVNHLEWRGRLPSPFKLGVYGGTGIVLLLLVAATIHAALKMRRMASYEWCMAASILAMVPWTGGVYLLSLPIGIWAFRTLRRPDVRDAFLQRAMEREQQRAASATRGRDKALLSQPRGSLGRTLLQCAVMLAILIGGSWLIHIAMTSGTDLRSTAEIGPLPDLHAAVANGDVGRVIKLLDAGASVNDKNADGQTPLMLAAENGHASLAVTLVLLGANVNETDTNNRTPLMWAAESGHASVLRGFRDVEGASNRFDAEDRIAATKQIPGVDRQLLKEKRIALRFLKINEDAQNSNGETALMKAAARGHADVVDLLMSDSDPTMRDNQGRTALMHAVVHKQLDFLFRVSKSRIMLLGTGNGGFAFSRFLDAKIVSLSDRDGKTAIQLAESSGQAKIAELLKAEMQRTIDHMTRAQSESGSDTLSAFLYATRAHAYRALGETEKAEADFKAAEETKPEK